MRTVQERLNNKTYVQGGPLLWGGAADEQGYGFISVKNKLHRVTRIVWEIVYGPIPEGMQINHLCDTPPCILPWHLYLGTHIDNMQDRRDSITHCLRGHSYDKENTAYYRCLRYCRGCRRVYAKARYWAKKGK